VAWLQGSIEGDRFEIKGGTLGLRKTDEQAVTRLSHRLVTDHEKSLADAVGLAKLLDVNVPARPSPSQRWELEELSEMHGKAFRHDYSELEVLDHQQDIDEATMEARLGCNSDVRSMAADEIPVLKIHLALAKAAFDANHTEH